jgi:formate hydrogenlyase subunit 3/multisubunit Na+/H+ antiporter MnhD subunit
VIAHVTLPGVVVPWALLLAVTVPLLLAVAALVPGLRGVAARSVPFAALPALGLAFAGPVTAGFDGLLLDARFGADGFGSIWLLVTALLWGCAGWFGVHYLAGDARRGVYSFYFLGAMAGNFGVVLARDPVTFYTAFAVMSFLSYGLVVHDGSAVAQRAGRVYLGMAVLGEVMQFAGLALALFPSLGNAPQTGFQSLEFAPAHGAAAWLFIGGFGIKAGVLGLHLWLPMAHPVAPTPASAVLSGSMIKAGLIGWMNVLPLGASALPQAGGALIALGLAGAVVAALYGAFQVQPKAVLAYSSVSQMGLLITGVGVGLVRPDAWVVLAPAVVLYAVHHALAKGLLFLAVGLKSVRPLGGVERALFWGGVAVAALALVGAPWTSGVVVKSFLKDAVYGSGLDAAGMVVKVLTVAAGGTTLLMARFVVTLRRVHTHDGHAASPWIWMPWLILLGLVMVLVFALTARWMGDGTLPAITMAGAIKALIPVAGGLLLYAMVAAALARTPRLAAWRLPPGDLIEVVATMGRVVARLGRTLAAAAAGMDGSESRSVIRRNAIAAADRLVDLENRLTRWPVGAVLLLFAAAAVFGWILR